MISIFFRDLKIKNRTFILFCISLFLISLTSILNKRNIYYPYKIADFIKGKISNECIFSSFEIGGFVEYFFYPENKVFLNGRLNAKREVLFDYSKIYYAEEDFIEVI